MTIPAARTVPMILPRLETTLPGLVGGGTVLGSGDFVTSWREKSASGESLDGFRLLDGDDLHVKAAWRASSWSIAMLCLTDGRLLCSQLETETSAVVRLYEMPAEGAMAGGDVVVGGDAVREFRGHSNWILGLAELPGGGRFAGAGGADACVRVWDVESGACVAVLRGHTAEVTSLAMVPSRAQLASAATDGTLRWWDVSTWECVCTVWTGVPALCAQVLPGGRLAIGGRHGWMAVWDLVARTAVARWKGHEGCVESMALLGGDRLVSGSPDRAFRLWELRGFACVACVEGLYQVHCVRALASNLLVVAQSYGPRRVYSFAWYRRVAAVRAWVVAWCGG